MVTAGTLSQLATAIIDGADIAVLGFKAKDPHGYGRLVTDSNNQISRIVEQSEVTDAERCTDLVNGGVMAARSRILFDLLQNVTPSKTKGEIYLTDIISLAIIAGHRVTMTTSNEDEIAGVNDRQDLAHIESLIQARLRVAAMQQGVTMHAPETVFLSGDVKFEQDVIIEPNVVITGCSVIGEGSVIKSFSHLDSAVLGPCCVIGPFARLRPGTVAEGGVKIGNFVETKRHKLEPVARPTT